MQSRLPLVEIHRRVIEAARTPKPVAVRIDLRSGARRADGGNAPAQDLQAQPDVLRPVLTELWRVTTDWLDSKPFGPFAFTLFDYSNALPSARAAPCAPLDFHQVADSFVAALAAVRPRLETDVEHLEISWLLHADASGDQLEVHRVDWTGRHVADPELARALLEDPVAKAGIQAAQSWIRGWDRAHLTLRVERSALLDEAVVLH